MNLTTPFPSYAQYNEDIILLALLYDVEKGFYVDVGANYPVIDSVTKLFYQHGWRGINIEPIPELYSQLKKDRPEDINLNIGIAERNGQLTFYENVHIPGNSSFKYQEHNKNTEIKEYLIPTKTLKSVLRNNNVKKIHFLKIDTEGFEDEVVNSNDWNKYRPEVICIEYGGNKSNYKQILEDNDYKLFIQDGLNEYYLSKESWFRSQGFEERVVIFSNNSMRLQYYRSWVDLQKRLKKLTKLNQIHYDIIQNMKQDKLLSFRGLTFFKRLKISIYGLTVDWIRFKLKK